MTLKWENDLSPLVSLGKGGNPVPLLGGVRGGLTDA
jgi:hypothetical protein